MHKSKETYLTKRDKLTEIDHLKMYLPLVDPWLFPPSTRKLLKINLPFTKILVQILRRLLQLDRNERFSDFLFLFHHTVFCACAKGANETWQSTKRLGRDRARYFVTLCHVKSRDVDNFWLPQVIFLLLVFHLIYTDSRLSPMNGWKKWTTKGTNTHRVFLNWPLFHNNRKQSLLCIQPCMALDSVAGSLFKD